jgi:predicted DNA-binding mobile mystery protein A
MSHFKHLKIRQVDSALAPFRETADVDRPTGGWTRAIREAYGMSLRQLAERMGVSKTTAATLERNEGAETIKLSSLRAVGAALDCELVYALVPRTSLEKLVRRRARLVAERVVGRVSDSMDLENQAIPPEERERQVAELTEELWQDMPKELWDDPL